MFSSNPVSHPSIARTSAFAVINAPSRIIMEWVLWAFNNGSVAVIPGTPRIALVPIGVILVLTSCNWVRISPKTICYSDMASSNASQATSQMVSSRSFRLPLVKVVTPLSFLDAFSFFCGFSYSGYAFHFKGVPDLGDGGSSAIALVGAFWLLLFVADIAPPGGVFLAVASRAA